MDDFRLEVDAQQVIEQAEKAYEVLKLAFKYAATDVWGNLRRYSPSDTGRLAGSWTLTQQSELKHLVYTDVHYAIYHQEGTGIYGPEGQPIQPQTRQALKFYWDKVGAMTVWKGDLQTPQQMASFAAWAEERGMKPFFTWPKGIPPYKPDGATPYVDYAIDLTENKVEEFVARAFREVGVS